MTRAEILAFNRGGALVADLAARSADATRAREMAPGICSATDIEQWRGG